MRYKVTYESGNWILNDTYRNRVVDRYQSKENAERVAALFENINLLARKDDDLK